MLRSYASIVEQQLAILDRPFPTLFATRLFAPSPYRDQPSRREWSTFCRRAPYHRSLSFDSKPRCGSLQKPRGVLDYNTGPELDTEKPEQGRGLKEPTANQETHDPQDHVWDEWRGPRKYWTTQYNPYPRTDAPLDPALLALAREDTWDVHIKRLRRRHAEDDGKPQAVDVTIDSRLWKRVRAVVKLYTRAHYQQLPYRFWQQLDLAQIPTLWTHMMLVYLLDGRDPIATARFLRKTLESFTPPLRHVIDVLDLLTYEFKPDKKGLIQSFWWATTVAKSRYHQEFQLGQESLTNILSAVRNYDYNIVRTVERFRKLDIHLEVPALISAATMLAAVGSTRRAMHCLRVAIEAGMQPTDERATKVCAEVLVASRLADGSFRKINRVVEAILELGIPLEVGLYNALISNATHALDSDTAWQLWYTMHGTGVHPNHVTYALLMRMCRKMDDPSSRKMFALLWAALDPEGHQYLHQDLVLEMIRCWRRMHTGHNFDLVLRFYECHCDLQPLRDLGIVPASYRSRSERRFPQPRPFPHRKILEAMIDVYLRCIRRSPSHMLPNSQKTIIRRLYMNFLRERANGNMAVLNLCAQPYIWNLFLKALGVQEGFFKPEANNAFLHIRGNVSMEADLSIYWRHILLMMQRKFPVTVVDDKTGVPLRPPKPDLVSYSIVLNAMARSGRKGETEGLLSLMKAQGFEPNDYIWNSMLAGYARHQPDVVTAGVLERMRRADVSPSKHTVAALERVGDKSNLLRITREMASGQRALPPRVRSTRHKPGTWLAASRRSGSRRTYRRPKREVQGQKRLGGQTGSQRISPKPKTPNPEMLRISQGQQVGRARQGRMLFKQHAWRPIFYHKS